MNVIARTQRLPIDLDAAWSFFSDPYNLARITPPSMGFDVLSGGDDAMYAGQIITYRIRPFLSIPTGWVTEITHVREPHFFVDEQRVGPYRFWHHQHHFEADGDGVVMRDHVSYIAPFGPLGALVDAVWINRQLNTIFDYRFATLEKLFPAS